MISMRFARYLAAGLLLALVTPNLSNAQQPTRDYTPKAIIQALRPEDPDDGFTLERLLISLGEQRLKGLTPQDLDQFKNWSGKQPPEPKYMRELLISLYEAGDDEKKNQETLKKYFGEPILDTYTSFKKNNLSILSRKQVLEAEQSMPWRLIPYDLSRVKEKDWKSRWKDDISKRLSQPAKTLLYLGIQIINPLQDLLVQKTLLSKNKY